MTCREKLKQMHPEWYEDQLDTFTRSYCPWEVGIDYPPEKVCRDSRCSECWNTEIPETENIKKENEVMNPNKMTKAQMIEEIENARGHIYKMESQLKNLERYKQYEDAADELKALHTAFMNSGFTNEQAFDLLKTMTQSMMPAALRSVGL